jgi:hypothetical protein
MIHFWRSWVGPCDIYDRQNGQRLPTLVPMTDAMPTIAP